MLFNSLVFAVFFILVCGLYWPLRRHWRAQNCLLLAASYVFYGWWDVRFLFLIVLSTTIDYCLALYIHHGRVRLGERLKASAALVAAALGFVFFRWDSLHVTRSGLLARVDVDWDQCLHPTRLGVVVLVAVLATVTFAHAIYPLVQRLGEAQRRKVGIVTSVVCNLAILGFFKYFNFFAQNLALLTRTTFGHDPGPVTLNIILPVGISFYHFQTMAYTIDVYRRQVTPTRSFLDFAAFLCFFPQLVAGPIERAAHMLPQFQRSRTLTADGFRAGVRLIVWGLFKKMVVADNAATIVSATFGPYDALSTTAVPDDGLRLLVAVYAFALQIYGDFSGYSDIARGTARLLGFEVMRNFDLPYFARSPSEFWRRWHISLSTWLRDYLYIPLGGSRAGTHRTYCNLCITMLLGGLWHGAAWTFVAWGAYHGVLLVGYRLAGFEEHKPRVSGPRALLAWLLMFHLICFGWLLFRARNVQTIAIFLTSILTRPFASPAALADARQLLYYSWLLLLVDGLQYFVAQRRPALAAHWFVHLNVATLVALSLLSLGNRGSQTFIYFAF